MVVLNLFRGEARKTPQEEMLADREALGARCSGIEIMPPGPATSAWVAEQLAAARSDTVCIHGTATSDTCDACVQLAKGFTIPVPDTSERANQQRRLHAVAIVCKLLASDTSQGMSALTEPEHARNKRHADVIAAYLAEKGL